jgi:hypothetical protein
MDSALGLFRLRGLQVFHVFSGVTAIFHPSICVEREAFGFSFQGFIPNGFLTHLENFLVGYL